MHGKEEEARREDEEKVENSREGKNMGRGEKWWGETGVCVCVSVCAEPFHPPHPIPAPNTTEEFGFESHTDTEGKADGSQTAAYQLGSDPGCHEKSQSPTGTKHRLAFHHTSITAAEGCSDTPFQVSDSYRISVLVISLYLV